MTKLSEKKGGGLIYVPGMTTYDGSTTYGVGNITYAGNSISFALEFAIPAFTGDTNNNVFAGTITTPSSTLAAMYGWSSDYTTDTTKRNKLQIAIKDSSNALVCRFVTTTEVLDGNKHKLWFRYDGDAGTAEMWVDGADDVDTGAAAYVAPITGTLGTGAGFSSFGASGVPDTYVAGDLGYFVFVGDYTPYNNIFDSFGNFRKIDEAGWSQFGGTEPYLFLPHGDVNDQRGAATTWTPAGTVYAIHYDDEYPMIGLPTIGTAEAWNIKTSKTAWVDGVEKVGTGYFPAMMQFDGSTGYYSKSSVTTSGNLVTVVLRIKRSPFTGGASERISELVESGAGRFYISAVPSDFATTDRRNKVNFFVQSSTPVTICSLFTETDVIDGQEHEMIFAFDGTTGVATLIVDGVVEDDTGVAARVAPTTGTLPSGSTGFIGVGATSSGTQPFGGEIGFIGYRDAYLTNWQDFMQTDGTPKQLDESTWTEWGAQPLFWNEHGDMVNNLGSAGAMTKNGAINVTEGGGGVAGMTANAWDIKTGKTAYLAGGSTTGTGYFPAMMQFDGSTGYYSDTSVTVSGNKVTVIVRVKIASFVNGGVADERYICHPIAGTYHRGSLLIYASDAATTDWRNKVYFLVRNSANATICGLISTQDICDNQWHTIFASFDGDAGTAVFKVDGVEADNTGATSRTAPTTGTISATTPALYVGTNSGASRFTGEQIGFFGYDDSYLTNWSNFMQSDGSPKPLDESTWTEWGAQPLFWHEAGKMDENLGSSGAMTVNGTITLGSAQ